MDLRISFLLLLPIFFAISACGQGEVDVKFTSAEATDFEGGRAKTCNLKGIVDNETKYHLEGLSFKVGDYNGEFGEMSANSLTKDPQVLFAVTLDQPDATCANVARYLNENASSASIFSCKMTGVAEGDCQGMVHISSGISNDDITQLAGFEQHQLEAALGPLHKAMAALVNPHDDNQILDALVQLDAQSWIVNKYDAGSMNGAAILSQSSDGSERVVRANYTFNGGQPGWVKVTLYKDTNALPCMEYWDREGSCGPLRLPDPSSYSVPVPMQPAPLPAAPNSDNASEGEQDQQSSPTQDGNSQQQPDQQPAAPMQPPPAAEDDVTSQEGATPKP